MFSYLDTNAWNDVDSFGELFLNAVGSRAVLPVLGTAVLEELSRRRRDERERVLTVIQAAVEDRLLHPRRELVKLEVQKWRALDENERYVDRERQRALWAEVLHPERVGDVATQVKEATARFKMDDAQRRDGVMAMTGMSRSEAVFSMRDWWKDSELRINEWTLQHLRDCRIEYGLPDDEARWPTPNALPTLRNFYAASLARLTLTVGDGYATKASDGYDIEHYAFATYADLLVTNDKTLREICRRVNRAGLIVENLQAFENRLVTLNQLHPGPCPA